MSRIFAASLVAATAGTGSQLVTDLYAANSISVPSPHALTDQIAASSSS
jgi:hypothetical protein